MSQKATAICWKLRLPMSEKVPALRLADMADDVGHIGAIPILAVAEDCGMSVRAVQYAIKKLIDLGLLLVIGNEQGGRGKAREYVFDIRRGLEAVAEKGANNANNANTASDAPFMGSKKGAKGANTANGAPFSEAAPDSSLTIVDGSSKPDASRLTDTSPPKPPRKRGGGRITYEPPAAFAADWAEFWGEWPHRVARPAALAAYVQARQRGAQHADILAGVARYKRVLAQPNAPNPAHPSTWLNQERWNDQPMQQVRLDGKRTHQGGERRTYGSDGETGRLAILDALGPELGLDPRRAAAG